MSYVSGRTSRPTRLGLELTVVPQDEIYGSAFASAVYISSVIKMPKDKKVYVIGMAGLEEELDEEGIAHIGGTVSPATVFPL